jgi:Holliday junction resolvase RusA-like endonuclease
MVTSPLNEVFYARINHLPPSANRMYIYTRRGPVPSKEMKQFKAKAALDILKHIRLDSEELDSNVPYRLVLRFFLPKVENKGWPKTAKTRFTKRDVSNLVKVLEDVVAKSLGIDDSCFLNIDISKADGTKADFIGVDVSIVELRYD